jgi:hypothetical protein
VAGTTFEIRLSLMLESFNTKLLDGGFRDSEAGLVSVKEVNIFCPPKGCLVVDILQESECQKLPASLCISLILI